MKERLPDYDLTTPISYWITAREGMADTLRGLGITWAKFTGTQYQGCKVPEGKVIQLWALWNEGRLMFGPEDPEEKTVASAILQSLKDRITGTLKQEERFEPFFKKVVSEISKATGVPEKDLVKPFKAVDGDPIMVVKKRKPQRRVK